MSASGSSELSPGDFFESIQVRVDDRGAVVEALQRVLRSMGFFPIAPASLPAYEGPIEEEVEAEARRFLVGPALDGWVPIFPSADLPEQLATAQRLSEETERPCLVLNLHNSDVFYYWLFSNGRLVDQYDSCPAYFDELRSADELEAVRGHPERVGSILPPGLEPKDLEAILTQTLAEHEANEPDPDQLVLWGDEQFAEFTRLLKIRNAAHSYEDAAREGLEGFVEYPDAFAELAFAPPLQASQPLQ